MPVNAHALRKPPKPTPSKQKFSEMREDLLKSLSSRRYINADNMPPARRAALDRLIDQNLVKLRRHGLRTSKLTVAHLTEAGETLAKVLGLWSPAEVDAQRASDGNDATDDDTKDVRRLLVNGSRSYVGLVHGVVGHRTFEFPHAQPDKAAPTIGYMAKSFKPRADVYFAPLNPTYAVESDDMPFIPAGKLRRSGKGLVLDAQVVLAWKGKISWGTSKSEFSEVQAAGVVRAKEIGCEFVQMRWKSSSVEFVFFVCADDTSAMLLATTVTGLHRFDGFGALNQFQD